MKRLLLLFALCGAALGQATNPQNTYVSSVLTNSPLLYLNLNDATTAFKDQVSGSAFGPTGTATVGSLLAPAGAVSAGYVVALAATLPTGVINQFSLQFYTVPTAGSFTLVIVSGTAPSLAIVSSFTVNVTATTSVQTFTAPTDFTAVTVSAGERFGYWASSTSTALAYNNTVSGFYFTAAASSLPSETQTYTESATQTLSLSAVVAQSSGGTATAQQPGFDSTDNTNYSAEFPYNAWNAAPNNTLGAIDWFTPWSMMLQVDRLNWSRSGSLMLASKGDLGSCAGVTGCTNANSWWQLFLAMDGANSQICFERNGKGNAIGGWSGIVGDQVCTNGSTVDAMPNGFNYNIMLENDGTGNYGRALQMYINGILVGASGVLPGSTNGNTYQYGFGGAQVSVSAGGTGYASTTYFTSIGGGANCTVAGYITASSGVMTTGTSGVIYSTDYGCTSTPTIVLTSPAGTGATFAYALNGASMNSTAHPVMVPGYVSNGISYGVDAANSSQAPTYVDEFAMFPSQLSFGAVSNIFYQTKFYQGLNKAKPANPIAVVFDDDGCNDLDNLWALQSAIAEQNLGYIRLVGVVQTNQYIDDVALFRQMLDQAGLSNVPVGTVGALTSGAGGSACNNANINTFNASTLGISSSFPSAATVYREAFAANPITPVVIFSGGSTLGISQFMQSAADSISPLTGLQLWAQDVKNGGALYMQGLGCAPSSLPNTANCTATNSSGGNLSIDVAASAYIFSNMQDMPVYFFGGTPQNSGPGPLGTRIATDPMYLGSVSWGTDVRQGWDSLLMANLVSSYFSNGVTIGFSGGTGYANSTPFYLSGGGTYCQGNGVMTASGGVPNGMTTNWGLNINVIGGSYAQLGVGSGCTGTPTVNLIGATGTGVTFTPYNTSICGTLTINTTGPVFTFTSATCSHQYVVFQNQNAAPGGGAPLFTWFLNSLIDPPPVGQPRLY